MLYKRELKIHSRKFIHLSGKITPELFRHDHTRKKRKSPNPLESGRNTIVSKGKHVLV